MEPSNEENLGLPRILCLHGGGTSAEVFQIQCRVIVNQLKDKFRLVFIDGPFPSRPHPAIVPYFGSEGPYYRWLRWHDDDPKDEVAEFKMVQCLQNGTSRDKGTGNWVAVMGFSQGAKMAASMLWAQENLQQQGLFKFGVFFAGRAPIVVIDPQRRIPPTPHTADLDQLSSEFTDWAPSNEGPHALTTPTLHVHGLQDPGLEMHRKLLNDYCKTGTTKLIEWDGDHRLPINTEDVQKVVNSILALATETGVLK